MIYAIDGSGTRSELRIFFEDEKRRVIMLHECSGVLEQYLDLWADREQVVYFIVNYSWYVTDEKALDQSQYFFRIREKFLSRFDIFKRLLILANSKDELSRFQWYLPEAVIENVNNCFSLSGRAFFVEHEGSDEKGNYDCIYNAKPLMFKRHYLTASLRNKIFISYGEDRYSTDKNYVNLRQFRPTELLWNVGHNTIRERINRSKCGLILSDIEGACYASVEYLLCGVPVVTTKSFGGRDEYYDANNSLTVNATAAEVSEGVMGFLGRAASEKLDRMLIRQNALNKQLELRQRLSIALSGLIGLPAELLASYINSAVDADSKLWGKINYWIKGVAADA